MRRVDTPGVTTFWCGDVVYRDDDPRHLGRVEAIGWCRDITVKWHDTGWKEQCDPRELMLYCPKGFVRKEGAKCDWLVVPPHD
jgi:hypothetical protein